MSTSPDVVVAKTGGRGDVSTSQLSVEKNLNLGSPQGRPTGGRHVTKGGVEIVSSVTAVPYARTVNTSTSNTVEENSAVLMDKLIDRLDTHRGVLLSSSYEFPGRYKRWSLGLVDPPLEITGRGLECVVTALNERGRQLLPAVRDAMTKLYEEGNVLESVSDDSDSVTVLVKGSSEVGSFSEEDRSRQPSLFSVVRALIDLFGYNDNSDDEGSSKHVDQQLGLYGAFGYDLTFQFEPIDPKQTRDPQQRDLLLYLPDEILVIDHDRNEAWIQSYDFTYLKTQHTTQGLARGDTFAPLPPSFEPYDLPSTTPFVDRDTPPSEFADSVTRAKEEFKVGNLFEVVLSQTFRHRLDERTPPSTLFRRLCARNPSPYGFLINLGAREYLVGASPEMFVRCQSVRSDNQAPNDDNESFRWRVETCPISGTVARGADALEDAQRVKSLIMNAKEESELTMCTDVDRNDKSRICEPGSVKVIGRRQIEMYSRLIHTVDHVEGYLRPGFDALDAFLCHTWAVTVTGAPKTWAIQFVEDSERSPRCWYGGAVGMVGFDGGLNTGLTLRTVRVKDGVAEVRAGATLLYDSNPIDEELETELKASAMIDAIVSTGEPTPTTTSSRPDDHVKVGQGKNIVLIDHEDSFVHTLGNYLRQTGADVTTLRSGPKALEILANMTERPDMVILSPGPGNPTDFGLSTTLTLLQRLSIPAFGVCLGLQGMVEHFGGTLGVLDYPMHGKPGRVQLVSSDSGSSDGIFTGLPDTFDVARYHSLYGIRESLPDDLVVTALSEDGVVMGIQHATLPYAAVQFHPESILTSPKHGIMILENALKFLQYK